MKNLSFHCRPRSIGAQIDRMRGLWPDFKIHSRLGNFIIWVGPLRGFQKSYIVGIRWGEQGLDRPVVFLIDPPLKPREGGTFEEIPHLMFDADAPESSGLCLFDPDGAEWSDHMLIADTTVPWSAKWLCYYEMWHYDGIWRGGGVGAESVAAARREVIHSKTKKHSPDA